jgi:hypothetical protein
MLHGVTETMGPWINKGIDQHGKGENIRWESALLPSPQTGAPTYTVVVWLPAAVLGEGLMGSFQINDPLGATEQDVVALMSDFLTQMRAARSQQVEQGAQQAQQPIPRGGQTASGLFVP